MTVGSERSVSRLAARLRVAGCVYAEDEAAVLLEAARDDDHLEAMTAERVAGRPLEQVVGWAEFRGLRLAVAPGVFVPRARSGLLVDLALPLLRPGLVVLDLCCGVGALGAALLATEPGIELSATDVDNAAVMAARRNLPTATVHRGDLYDALPDALRSRIDLVVCNAPYVPTDAVATMPPEARDHERRQALDGGADGLDVHRRVAAGLLAWLSPGGTLLIETSRSQAARSAELFRTPALAVHVATDDAIEATAVVVRDSSRREGAPAYP